MITNKNYLRKNEFHYGTEKSKIGRHPFHVTVKHGYMRGGSVITHSKRFFNKPTAKLHDNPNKSNKQKYDKRPSRISIFVWLHKNDLEKKKLENFHMSNQNLRIEREHRNKYK